MFHDQSAGSEATPPGPLSPRLPPTAPGPTRRPAYWRHRDRPALQGPARVTGTGRARLLDLTGVAAPHVRTRAAAGQARPMPQGRPAPRRAGAATRACNRGRAAAARLRAAGLAPHSAAVGGGREAGRSQCGGGRHCGGGTVEQRQARSKGRVWCGAASWRCVCGMCVVMVVVVVVVMVVVVCVCVCVCTSS